MKVLFLPGWYPNRTHATLGNFVQRHAEAAASLHEVTVVHQVGDPSARGMEWEVRTRGSLSEHILYAAAGPLARMRAVQRRTAELQRSQGAFRVVHGNILHATAPQLWMTHRRWRIPYLVSENWTGYHLDAVRHLPRLQRFSMHVAARRAALLCPVSDQLAIALWNHGFRAPTQVVPNVVDTDLFHPGSGAVPQARTRFLHISTLVDAHKNVTGLLQAFAAARQQVPAIHLHIMGDGDATPHRATAEQLGLTSDALSFGGPARPDTIAKQMREYAAFVLPSHVENLPCVMLEAFASGLPVVATAVGGIPEHLTPDRGILLPKADVPALRDALVALASGKLEFDPGQIRAYAVERFSNPVVAHAFDAAYQRIVAHG